MSHHRPALRLSLLAVCACAVLAACSSDKPPPPSPLQANPATVPTNMAWTNRLTGGVRFPLQVAAVGDQVLLGDSSGNVQALSAASGNAVWNFHAGQALTAGVGFDGATAAVVTASSQLVALRNGTQLWRVALPTQSSTPPLVAGGRVFLLGSDYSVTAFDASNGYRLWRQKGNEMGGKLALRQASVLMAAQGQLWVGVAGRVVAFNPDTGAPIGEIPLASPRGLTELSQVVDLLAPASRQGNSLCARAYQSTVGCLNLGTGRTEWFQPTVGSTGVAGDGTLIVGADNNGVLTAWARADGKPLWKNETFKYRRLSAPLVAGNSIVVGDGQGYVHILDRTTGTLRNRVSIDNSPIEVAPVLAGNTVVVVSNKGTVAGLRVQ